MAEGEASGSGTAPASRSFLWGRRSDLSNIQMIISQWGGGGEGTACSGVGGGGLRPTMQKRN
jgi:hypothetical protein